MREVSTIGLDLAKSVFHTHGADVSGAVLFRKKLRSAISSSRSSCLSLPARWQWGSAVDLHFMMGMDDSGANLIVHGCITTRQDDGG
jgi:hypothetical protein